MSGIDFLYMFLFTAVIIVAGSLFARSGASIKSFFAGGGNVPWWISGLSLFMSFFSAGTFVVWGSIAYKSGWVAVSIQWTMLAAGIIVALWIAPKWKEQKIITVAEFITRRFGSATQQFYSWIFLLLSIFTAGNFMYPVAKIIEVTTGLPINAIIVVIGLGIILYTSVGGYWAVLITDVIQFFVLFVTIIAVVPSSLRLAGGISGFIRQSPDDFFQLFNSEFTPGFLLAFIIYNAFFLGGNWAYVQRYTSVRDRRAARKTGLLFSALYAVSPVIWMIPPMVYRIINPGLQGLEPEGAYLMMCMKVLPAGMIGLLLTSMIFATASSVNTTLNIAAAVLTNDIYKHYFQHSNERSAMVFARLATVIYGLLTIGVALLVKKFGGIVETVLSVAAIAGVPLLAPPIWALFSKKITGKKIICTTIVSVMINITLKFGPFVFNIPALSRSLEMITGVGIPLVILLLFEFTGKKNSLFPVVVPRNEESDEISETSEDIQNIFAYRILGGTLAVLGLLFLTIGITSSGQGVVIFASSAFLMLLGLIIAILLPKKKVNDH